ncbi:MAG: trigger factor [Gemmatimonadetes bacterium]|nr:trigger factor [Gemmatimonadota bacterium]
MAMTLKLSHIEDIAVAVEERERWHRRVSVRVPAVAVEAARREIARDLAGRLKLPGFRKGRVPADLVEKRYGEALRRETLDKVIGEAYREALRRESLRPISEGRIEAVDYEPERDLTFAVSFDVAPEIQVGRLGGFRVGRPVLSVDETQVERVVQRLREEQGVWRPAEDGRPQLEDLVSVEMAPVDADGAAGETRTYELVLGAGDALPDVEAGILTLEPRNSGEFTVRFPDDFPDEGRRGKEQRLRITLLSRKVREIPELDDEFARSLGEFTGVDDLRGRIARDLEHEARDREEAAVRAQLVDLLLEANAFEVPESMVERYLDRVLGSPEGVPEQRIQEARAALRADAERQVKRALLIDRIAETQALLTSDEEVEARIQQIAQRAGRSASEVRAQLQRAQRIEAIGREITEDKVFELLKAQSEIVDERPRET